MYVLLITDNIKIYQKLSLPDSGAFISSPFSGSKHDTIFSGSVKKSRHCTSPIGYIVMLISYWLLNADYSVERRCGGAAAISSHQILFLVSLII
jgi:hypothetical protein